MSLRQAGCVKSALNTAGLTLQADVGESFLVKAIHVGRVTTDAYLAVKIDNFAVGYWLVKGKRGGELGGQRLSYKGVNLMKLLVDRGLPFSYPIAEGQKLVLPALDGIGSMQVVYDIYDAADIKADQPNGTLSKKFGFIQYLRESSVLTASGDMLLDTAITPAEFPDFPAGKPVPARMKIKLHGIHGSPVADFVSSGNGFYTKYLKLIREREVLLDEDRNGILFLGYASATTAASYAKVESIIGSGGEQTDADADFKFDPPLFFNPALEFLSGEELLVYLTWVKVGTHTMAADLPAVGLILEVNRE
ncbi:MAG: hypothetical protein MUP81_03720 [Dehalococcoidia bacterium]|nr:hypothetical protein [Dehalococcoidia bacterium]